MPALTGFVTLTSSHENPVEPLSIRTGDRAESGHRPERTVIGAALKASLRFTGH